MARRKNLTDKQVAKLEIKEKRYNHADPELVGHYVRIAPSGRKVFGVFARREPLNGESREEKAKIKKVWFTIGPTDHYRIEDARERARIAIKRIKAGLTPTPPPEVRPDSFKAVAENYLKLHVKANNLRSQSEIERIFEKYFYPAWADNDFESIRRSDVTKLLDTIADNSKWEADHALAHVRRIMNWYATRSDEYVSPIVQGMRRTDPKDRARDRILSHEEIRLVWEAAGSIGTYGSMVRFALLTAQRKGKIDRIQWSHLDGDIWNIPRDEDDRGKGHASKLKLPQMALDVLADQKQIEGNPYVFAGRTEGYFSGNSKAKARLDSKVTALMREAAQKRGVDPTQVEPLDPWRFHDLRRTASTLMNEAGVRPDIVERVLGHAIEGVAGVYNRAEYEEMITKALEVLANQIEMILNPPEDNVVDFRGAGG
jgi:integrase